MKKVLILGGTQFFGKRLVHLLLGEGAEVTIATRGKAGDPFGDTVDRLRLDRADPESVRTALAQGEWDVAYDQTCYSPQEAAEACQALDGRIGRYVFTSTMAVYPFGEKLSEADYDPYSATYELGKGRQEYRGMEGYRTAKRHSEAYLFQASKIPVAAVRFPLVIGPDDYSERLKFYVDQALQGTAAGIPNPAARLSFISSAEAADFLFWAGGSDWTGPVNAASQGDLSHIELFARIARVTNREGIWNTNPDAPNRSPYAFPDSWTLDASKAAGLGFRFQPLDDYLPGLLAMYAERADLRLIRS